MSPRPAPAAPLPQASDFKEILGRMAAAPLHEFCPAGPGTETAALGFALAFAASWAGAPGVILAGDEGVFAEDGAPYPVGLTQYGLDPQKLIVIRCAKRDETLWSTEQALSARGAVVICALSGRGKPLDLKATRRLLLFAERNGSRCLLVRPLAEASAAWTRWRIDCAASNAEPEELGSPAFSIELIRSRSGPSGALFTLDWNADARRLEERVARDLSAAPQYGSADQNRARA